MAGASGWVTERRWERYRCGGAARGVGIGFLRSGSTSRPTVDGWGVDVTCSGSGWVRYLNAPQT